MDLHAAARAGDCALVAQMLLDGAIATEVDDHGVPVIFDAIDSGESEIVRLLLLHGADPSQRHEVIGFSPVDEAVRERDFVVVKLLADAGASLSMQLHRVCSAGDDPESVLALLDAGADPTETDRDGWTPLRFATVYGYVRSIEVLERAQRL